MPDEPFQLTMLQEIVSKRVSFQQTVWSSVSKELTVEEVLNQIRDGNHSVQVERLRNTLKGGDSDQYNLHKKNLPAVTFCGTFKERRIKECISSYNNLLVLDIDKIAEQEIDRIKEILRRDEFVLSLWESPSKLGLKGLVALEYEEQTTLEAVHEAHKDAFSKVRTYFLERYRIEIDESGNDTTRLCFMSSDDKLVIKSQFNQFHVPYIERTTQKANFKLRKGTRTMSITTRDHLLNPGGRNDPGARKTIQSIIRYLEKRKLSITKSYEEWYRVAYAIADTFTHDIGEGYFLRLCRLDGSKHDELASKNMLLYCYENTTGQLTFGTIEHFANLKGYVRSRGGDVLKTTGGKLFSRKFQP